MLSNTTDFENVTSKGVLNIPGGGSEKLLSLHGSTFTNDGVATVNSTGSGSAAVRVTESLLLSGSGRLVLAEPFVFGSRLDITAGVTLTQAPGHTIQGRGVVGTTTAGTLINNGTLAGASSSELLDVNSTLAGEGLVRNVFIDGIHSPGNPQTGHPTASVPIEGEYNFGNGPGINGDNRLIIEIGGTTPGDDYDQLVSADPANVVTIRTFGTVLDVSLINGFVPSGGDTFVILTTAGTINGMFAQVILPALPPGLTWDPVNKTSTSLTLSVSCTSSYDFDCDGDVDLDDFGLFQVCISGPGISLTPGCQTRDFDVDDDVDQSDFGAFQRCYSGAGNPPDPSCMN